jgi:SOS-response transcriptional repressor LexA
VKGEQMSENRSNRTPIKRISRSIATNRKDPGTYGLIWDGDEMSPYVKAGDLLLVEPNREAKNGDLVIARLTNGTVLARWYWKKGSIVLLFAENRKFEALKIPQSEIVFTHRCREIQQLVSKKVKRKSPRAASL